MYNANASRLVFTAAIAVAAVPGYLLIAPPARAQQPPIERVEITGSTIKRIDAETALPVQIIRRDEIEKTGAVNVEQFLQGLGVAMQGNSNSVSASSSGAAFGGVSTVSLRGLGSQRTLVLIDGKRVSGGGIQNDSTSVDINHIPVSAIERVEVLKDGASAIYGSDAIGGVVNFILRKDYKGGETTAFASIPQESGARGGGLNALFGFGNLAEDRYNITLIADFRKEDALYGRQRGFASSGISVQHLNDTSSGNTFPANFIAADGSFPDTRNPSFPACPGPYATNSPLFSDPKFGVGSVGCRFDPSPLVSLLPKTDQRSIFATGRFAFTKEIEGYGQLSYSKKESQTILQAVPLSDQFILPVNHPLANQAPYFDPASGFGFNTFLLTSSSPHYPGAFLASQGIAGTPDLLIRYRSAGTGDRDFTNISEQKRVVLGVKGTAFAWDYDAAFLHVDTQLREHVNNGYPLLTKILPLLNSGQVNPFGPNTPAVQAQIDATQFHGDAYKTKTYLDGVQAKVTHDLMQLGGGPLALALGTEARREGFKLDPSAEIVIGDISGYGGNFLPVDKKRNVEALFAEVSVPIVRTVELTAAARYDNYQGSGSRTSPKFGARWQPVKQVLFRGSFGEGFRAPSLTDLYQPQTTAVTAPGLSDPARCEVNPNDARSCNTQFPITVGGSTSLKPETSKNRTLGMVLEPTNNVSLAADYWEVDLKNTIIFGVQPSAILADPDKFASFIRRAAPDPSCPGCPGQIVDINQTNLNLGKTKVRGLDIDGRWRMPLAAAGTFTLGFNGTYISKYEIQNPDGSNQSINGMVSPIVNGSGGVIPRWRHYAYIDWRLAPWNVTFAQQYQSHYKDIPGTFEDTTDPAFKPHTVGEYQLFHLYVSYTGLMKEQLRITFGIRNLFDKDPPYSNAGGLNYFQGGYDPGYADPRGRTFLLSATYKFL